MKALFTYGNWKTRFAMKYWLKKKGKTEEEICEMVIEDFLPILEETWISHAEKRKHKKIFKDYQNAPNLNYFVF